MDRVLTQIHYIRRFHFTVLWLNLWKTPLRLSPTAPATLSALGHRAAMRRGQCGRRDRLRVTLRSEVVVNLTKLQEHLAGCNVQGLIINTLRG